MASTIEQWALTKNEAFVMATWSQQQSPLLQLPGELRNRIYDYVLRDVTLSVYRSSKPPTYVQVVPHVTVGCFVLSRATLGFDVTGLTRACRQLHAETRLLLFRLVTFHVYSDGSFVEFIKTLSPEQRNAIATIQMTTMDASIGGELWHSVTHFAGNDFNAQQDHLDLLEWSDHLAFDRLDGLERVVVEENSQWTYVGDREPTLAAGIYHCTKHRNIEIVVPKSIPWS